jgi:hypothetical protein
MGWNEDTQAMNATVGQCQLECRICGAGSVVGSLDGLMATSSRCG